MIYIYIYMLEMFNLPKFMLEHVVVLNGMDAISRISNDKGIGQTISEKATHQDGVTIALACEPGSFAVI